MNADVTEESNAEDRSAETVIGQLESRLKFLAAILGGYPWKEFPLDDDEAWGLSLIIEDIIKDVDFFKRKFI
jgi:hypothetical protein